MAEVPGHLLARSGQPDEVARHFLRPAGIRLDGAQPIRGLAVLVEAQGKLQESLRFWREVLELPPNDSAIHGGTSHIHRLEQARADLCSSPAGVLPSAEDGS
ncbi:MAG: hypothetical protein WCI75_05440 [candidate division NC10 bacterium]